MDIYLSFSLLFRNHKHGIWLHRMKGMSAACRVSPSRIIVLLLYHYYSYLHNCLRAVSPFLQIWWCSWFYSEKKVTKTAPEGCTNASAETLLPTDIHLDCCRRNKMTGTDGSDQCLSDVSHQFCAGTYMSYWFMKSLPSVCKAWVGSCVSG